MSYVPSSNLVPLVPRIRHEYSVSVESVDFKKGKFHNDLWNIPNPQYIFLSQYNYQKEIYRLMISINDTFDMFCDTQVPY